MEPPREPHPPAVRATLAGVPFAPHDMALSRKFALFVSSPTRVDIAPFVLGVRGPAQCTTFDAARTLPPDATSLIHLVPRDPAGGAAGGEGPPPDALAVPIGAPYHPVHMANAWDEEAGAGAGAEAEAEAGAGAEAGAEAEAGTEAEA